MKKEQKYFDFNKWKSEKNIPIRKIKIFQLEKGKYSKQIKEIFTIRKYSCQKKKGNVSNQKKENIPITKTKIFQLRKGKHYNQKGKYYNSKKENITIRKRKIVQLV